MKRTATVYGIQLDEKNFYSDEDGWSEWPNLTYFTNKKSAQEQLKDIKANPDGWYEETFKPRVVSIILSQEK